MTAGRLCGGGDPLLGIRASNGGLVGVIFDAVIRTTCSTTDLQPRDAVGDVWQESLVSKAACCTIAARFRFGNPCYVYNVASADTSAIFTLG